MFKGELLLVGQLVNSTVYFLCNCSGRVWWVWLQILIIMIQISNSRHKIVSKFLHAAICHIQRVCDLCLESEYTHCTQCTGILHRNEWKIEPSSKHFFGVTHSFEINGNFILSIFHLKKIVVTAHYLQSIQDLWLSNNWVSIARVATLLCKANWQRPTETATDP